MDYEVKIKNIEASRVAYMNYSGLVTQANEIFPNIFKAIGGKASGPPFLNYISMDSKTKIGDIEICVPTAKTPIANGIRIKEIPGVKAACISHIGSYETLNLAYEAIKKFSIDNDIELSPPFREVFIKGPGLFFKGNPNKYITEIIFPIESDL